MALRTERVVPPKLLEEVLNVTSSALPSSDIVKKLRYHSYKLEWCTYGA